MRLWTLIQKINDDGNTILVVTHEEDIAHMCKRIVHLKDGVIVEDKKVKQVRAELNMFDRDTFGKKYSCHTKKEQASYFFRLASPVGIGPFFILVMLLASVDQRYCENGLY